MSGEERQEAKGYHLLEMDSVQGSLTRGQAATNRAGGVGRTVGGGVQAPLEEGGGQTPP